MAAAQQQGPQAGTRPRAARPSWAQGSLLTREGLSCAGTQPGAPMPSARPLRVENGAQCTLLPEEMDGEEEERGLRFGPAV